MNILNYSFLNQISYLFALESLKDQINDPELLIVYKQTMTDIFKYTKQPKFYPLFETFVVQHKIQKQLPNKQKKAFHPVDYNHIHHFVPCIMSSTLKLKFLFSYRFDIAFGHTLFNTNLNLEIKSIAQLLDVMEGSLKQSFFVSDAQRIMLKVKKYQNDDTKFTEKESQIFLKLAAAIFKLEIVILNASKTKNRNAMNKESYELYDYLVLKSEGQMRKSEIIGTVYLFWEGGILYHPVVPADASLAPYLLKEHCLEKQRLLKRFDRE